MSLIVVLPVWDTEIPAHRRVTSERSEPLTVDETQ